MKLVTLIDHSLFFRHVLVISAYVYSKVKDEK